MSTTIPNILRALANKCPNGFTPEDLKEAFVRDGYGSEKAQRRTKQVVASGEVQVLNGLLYTIYSPVHYSAYPDLLGNVRVKAVKIERDGTITYL